MAKELPVLPSPKQSETPEKEELTYSRVFCTREDSPPLKLLLDFLKSKNQVPLIPKMDPAALEDWDWVHVSLGYSREKKPIQLFCVRNRGTYQDVFEGEKTSFFNRITVFDDVEAEIARECISTARFIATTQMVKKDMTDEGYDFNGWILEFFQENCNGIVQIDGQGFFSPKGDLIVDMEEVAETGDDFAPTPKTDTQTLA